MSGHVPRTNRRHDLLRGPGWVCAALFLLSACGGGGGSGSSVPAAAPTATPTAVGILPITQPTVAPSPASSPVTNAAAYVCPTSDTAGAAVAGRSAAGERVRRPAARHTSASPAAAATQLLAVTYDARTAGSQKSALQARESALGTSLAREYTFAHANVVTHVLRVPAAQVSQVEAALRPQSGVRSVGLTGTRRFKAGVTQPYFTSDPYFRGFSTTVAPSTGAAAPPATFEVGPLEESAAVPGQWDMHATRLEYAFAYSQANNGSGVTNRSALGSSAVKIAIIDTGEDTTHPELAAKIAYQHCFITDPNNAQSTSAFTTDEDGHGTDVAGIAGEATNNALGFTAAGGNVELSAYRVFPTPDDNCSNTNTTDNVCSTNTQDIASAIEDAIAQHVNVISLSLGGSACVSGADPDSLEGSAVADAIAANIVVVAAAGNGSGPPVEAPACDPGVIAVGATSLADGTANGSSKTGGSSAAPFEYVASYSDYGSPGAVPGSASAWGIVAPGGDPTNANDDDDLHWIENIWTSTPFMAAANDQNFVGNCMGDYPTQSGVTDCRILIAGTSMATPHVAGAAALIISVNASYQSPALMKTLLCSTADDIGDANEGCGRLDVYRAMARALGDTNPPAAAPIP
jgi:subtilisin family serine protease